MTFVVEAGERIGINIEALVGLWVVSPRMDLGRKTTVKTIMVIKSPGIH